jgi:hypothetical protein
VLIELSVLEMYRGMPRVLVMHRLAASAVRKKHEAAHQHDNRSYDGPAPGLLLNLPQWPLFGTSMLPSMLCFVLSI